VCEREEEQRGDREGEREKMRMIEREEEVGWGQFVCGGGVKGKQRERETERAREEKWEEKKERGAEV